MTKKEIISKIESNKVWNSAKHRYAEKLLNEYDSDEVRNYLWNVFKQTGDYFYASIVKNTPYGATTN